MNNLYKYLIKIYKYILIKNYIKIKQKIVKL